RAAPCHRKNAVLQPVTNRYNRMEVAGAFGDLGTLVPLVVAYLAVLKMDPYWRLVRFRHQHGGLRLSLSYAYTCTTNEDGWRNRHDKAAHTLTSGLSDALSAMARMYHAHSAWASMSWPRSSRRSNISSSARRASMMLWHVLPTSSNPLALAILVIWTAISL